MLTVCGQASGFKYNIIIETINNGWIFYMSENGMNGCLIVVNTYMDLTEQSVQSIKRYLQTNHEIII